MFNFYIMRVSKDLTKGTYSLDKYKKLISNTLIFAIGTFSSKVLVFLLMPFYTRVLTRGELGTADLIVQTSNLIIPIVSVGLSNAIIRFGLDHAVDKRDVFTGGITILGCGYALFLVLRPLLMLIPMIDEHTHLIYLYVLTSCLRSLCSQFVRAREYVRLYAFDGVLSTVMVILFNVLFLVVFDLGITGYVIATICSDFLSACFLFFIAGLHRFIRYNGIHWRVVLDMLRFAVPLIPANVFWWITNVSDRYFVTYLLSSDENGLYAMAYKIPTMIILVSGIFTDAWQMSAITENGNGRDRFFTNVASAYQAVIFTAGSGLILFTKLLGKIFWAPAFYDAWRYVPFLVLATVFSCFVTFLGSIYLAEKRSVATLVTTIAGAVLNVILNFLLIPNYGVNGAAFATFMSYFTVFALRAVDTRRFIKIHWNLPKLMSNVAVLLVQSWIMLQSKPGWIFPVAGLCALMIAMNFRLLLTNLQKLLSRRKRG